MKIFLLNVLFLSSLFSYGFPQYYYEIKDVKKQKKEFVNILEPLIEKANAKVLEERAFVKEFFANASSRGFRSFSKHELQNMIKIAKKYRIKKLFARSEFLKKVDVIPVSLGLTQGALESGWAKSRFVKEANNIFGHWTWGEVGLVPNDREEGKSHKIRIFKSLQNSVNAYVLNLNRNYAYKDFRHLRHIYKKTDKKFTGLDAATTMHNYSELDDEYVTIIQKMMQRNNFSV